MSVDVIEEIPGGAPVSRPKPMHVPGGDPLSRRAPISDPFVAYAPDDVEARRRQRVDASIADYDPFVPRGPMSVEERRQRPVMDGVPGGDPVSRSELPDRFVPGAPRGIAERMRAVTPLGDEEVMLLEGGPTALDRVLWRDDAYNGLGEGEPATDPTQRLNELRAAMCKARDDRVKLQARVDHLDAIVAKVATQLQAAKARGDRLVAEKLAAQVVKLDALRANDAAQAIRLAKVEAVSQLLARNAKTQANLTTLAKLADAKGKPDEAKVLRAASTSIDKVNDRYHAVRRQQMANHQVAAEAGKLQAANTLLAQAARDIRDHRKVGKPVPEALNVRAAKLAQTVKASQQKLLAAGIQDLRQISVTPVEAQAAVANGKAQLAELGFSISSISGAIKAGASAVSGAVKSGISKAADAAKSLAQKGACLVASNPSVLKAAASAAGSAGVAASGAAATMLKGACPQPTAPRPTTTSVFGPPVPHGAAPTPTVATPVPTKSIAPVVIAGSIGAAALLFLL